MPTFWGLMLLARLGYPTLRTLHSIAAFLLNDSKITDKHVLFTESLCETVRAICEIKSWSLYHSYHWPHLDSWKRSERSLKAVWVHAIQTRAKVFVNSYEVYGKILFWLYFCSYSLKAVLPAASCLLPCPIEAAKETWILVQICRRLQDPQQKNWVWDRTWTPNNDKAAPDGVCKVQTLLHPKFWKHSQNRVILEKHISVLSLLSVQKAPPQQWSLQCSRKVLATSDWYLDQGGALRSLRVLTNFPSLVPYTLERRHHRKANVVAPESQEASMSAGHKPVWVHQKYAHKTWHLQVTSGPSGNGESGTRDRTTPFRNHESKSQHASLKVCWIWCLGTGVTNWLIWAIEQLHNAHQCTLGLLDWSTLTIQSIVVVRCDQCHNECLGTFLDCKPQEQLRIRKFLPGSEWMWTNVKLWIRFRI